MAVLVLLIVLDLVAMGIVMYFVVREPQHRQPAQHPFVAEAMQAAPPAPETEAEPEHTTRA